MSGDRVTRHSYFPFGDRVDGAPDYATHEFTGHERDRETGLDYMMARYYGSSVARFFSPDPAFEITKSQRTPQQWNRYSYVMNNPLILIDPEGKVLTASGSQSAKDSFKQAADSGLMGKEVKVDSSGNVTLVSTDEQGPPTPEQSALEDTLNQAINDPATTSVNLTEGSPSALVGEYGTGEIDVKDVKALGTTPGVSAVGALGHEIAEQFSRQVKGMPPGNDTSGAHGAGIAAEDRINGSKRGPEFDILIRNKDGTASGVKEIPYTENGKKTISTLHIKHNDVTKVTER